MTGEPDECFELSGDGRFVSAPLQLPAGQPVLTLSHSGPSSFLVEAIQQGQRVTVLNMVGEYRGQRLLRLSGTVSFSVSTVGRWSLRSDRIPSGGQPGLNGTGDVVGPLFDPPPPLIWRIEYRGTGNFIVWRRCRDGGW